MTNKTQPKYTFVHLPIKQVATNLANSRAARALVVVGINIYAVKLIVLCPIFGVKANNRFGLLHVFCRVLVVGNHRSAGFPRSEVYTAHIFIKLVDHCFGFSHACHRHTANTNRQLRGAQAAAFVVAKHHQDVVGGERAIIACALVALPRQQHWLTVSLHLLGELAVVEAAAAKQQQMLQSVALGVGATVVEHLAHLAICHGIGRTRRKFVINRFWLHHQHAHSVEALVQRCHTLRLSGKFLGSDYYQVGS